MTGKGAGGRTGDAADRSIQKLGDWRGVSEIGHLLDVALEYGRFGQPRQTLSNGVGSCLADPLDRK